MKEKDPSGLRNNAPLIFELLVWFMYVCLYKYSFFLDQADLPNPQFDNFPHPQLIFYAICMTLYTIPFYRWIAPSLLLKKKYWWLLLAIVLYFWIVLKVSNWMVTGLFTWFETGGPRAAFYATQHVVAREKLFMPFGWAPNTLLTDILAFLAVGFMRYAFENEKKKHLLEKDNLVLQLASLKAQLHPHFLFNTLNSIYGMSLAGNKDTPAFILRLSDMMRYILYDCQQHTVQLEKDIAFLQNYLEMEKKRYPDADIQFTVSGDPAGKNIAPLIFIQFLENSFKHGSHRINTEGFIHGFLEVEENQVRFELRNDYLGAPQLSSPPYGGVGIDNVKKRLALYYPGNYTFTVHKDQRIFEVILTISL